MKQTGPPEHIYIYEYNMHVNRMRLAVRGVPKGALRTHSAQQAPLKGAA